MRSTAIGAALLLLGAAFLAPLASFRVQAATADWTFLVYLDADNNLEDVGILDFLEMATVGSTSRVNVLVQFDRAAGYDASYGDWTSVKRFRVLSGITPTAGNAIADLGELDMSDPVTLVDFALWGVTNYPARHYFLDLWDHGFGWPGILQDGASYMATPALAGALSQVTTALGRSIDVVGNDACRMTLEIMDELQPYVDYFVGSQKDEPADGWPYDAFLAPVVANPSMSPIDVGSSLVAAYVASYEGTSPYSVTLSLVSSASLPGLVATFAGFVAELNASVPYLQGAVNAARSGTESYEGGQEFDLYDFASNVQGTGNTRLDRHAAALIAAIASAVISHAVWDNPSPVNGIRASRAHGLSIWFPTSLSDPSYSALALSRATGWDEFLRGYGLATPSFGSIQALVVSVDTTVPGDGLADTIEVRAQAPRNGTLAVDLFNSWHVALAGFRDVQAVANDDVLVMFSSLRPGIYTASLLYYVSGKLTVISTFYGLAIQGLYRISGTVLDARDRSVVGAYVTLTNAARKSLNTTSGAQGFAFDVVIPDFLSAGDALDLVATFAGRTTAVRFVPNLDVTSASVNLVLDVAPTPDVTVPIVLAVVFAGATFLLAAIVLWQRRTLDELHDNRDGP